MKTLGIILTIGGFVAGALFAVLRVDSVAWLPYVLALMAGMVGLIMVKLTHNAGARDEHRVAGNLDTLQASLDNISTRLDELAGRRDKVPAHEFRFEIDRWFREDLDRFAEARESMQHAFGLQAYADIMSAFAAGERYLNRVWTASADGYIDEIMTYLDKAHRQFREAREAFNAQRD